MPRISQADLHALVQAQWEHEELGSGGDDGAGEFALVRPGLRAAKIVRYAHTTCLKGRRGAGIPANFGRLWPRPDRQQVTGTRHRRRFNKERLIPILRAILAGAMPVAAAPPPAAGAGGGGGGAGGIAGGGGDGGGGNGRGGRGGRVGRGGGGGPKAAAVAKAAPPEAGPKAAAVAKAAPPEAGPNAAAVAKAAPPEAAAAAESAVTSTEPEAAAVAKAAAPAPAEAGAADRGRGQKRPNE